MKKVILISAGVMLAAIIVLLIVNRATSKEDLTQLETVVKFGKFDINVVVTGELQAEQSVQISGPAKLRTSRSHRFSQIKITDLIPEGTIVKEGDYIATLDRSDATNRLKDLEDEIEEKRNTLERVQLDTTINLRNLRDDLVNLEYNMEEAEITLEQSIYESPAVIRQAQINQDKAGRAFQQAKLNYRLKAQQYRADIREAKLDLAREQRDYNDMVDLISQFTILAPAPGMVIYQKEWGGQKRKVGSMISAWDLTVATLPDLSSLISKTYVNEIDISKISKGQSVRIGVDAFPDKEFMGEILEVANIGEQLPNTDAKVFEVVIKLDGVDPVLRPAMTTSNQIITAEFDSVMSIPLEAIHVEDSIPIVFKKNGVKQVVLLGQSNENEVIVEAGLSPGDKILLSLPEDTGKFKFEGEDIIVLIRERAHEKKLEDERMKAEAARVNKQDKKMQQFMRMGGGSAQGTRGSFSPNQGSQLHTQEKPENKVDVKMSTSDSAKVEIH